MSEDSLAQLAGFRAGSLVGEYRLEKQVGVGWMAVVFRARGERLGRLVALKIVTPVLAADGAFRRRFIAESRLAAVVDDPHIIPVHEVGEADGVLFIAMRFVQGGDLRGVLEQAGALPPGRAAEFISPVASALDAAHRAGLVHRDVKPTNILVDGSADRPDRVYLSDFGVSKGATASVSLTGTGQFLGTPDYSAPEQIQGRIVDGRADQYALACVAYQLLTGSVPFERDQGMAVLLAHLSEPPPSLCARRPDLPAEADRVLARALAKTPEERYGSCVDFAGALREALGLAPYHSRALTSASDRPQTQMVSPAPEFPVSADSAAASTTSATATAALLVAETASPPAYSAAGQTEAEPDVGPAAHPGDDERRTTPPPWYGHPGVDAGGPGSGPGVNTRRGRRPRPRRGGRGPVILVTTVIGIVVVGLVIAITTMSGTPSTSASGTPSTSASGTPSTSASGTPSTSVSGAPGTSVHWTYTTAGPVYSSPAVAGGIVYVGSADYNVYALNAATGHLRWSYTTGGPVNSSPVVAGGIVYVGSYDHKVYALDAASGHFLWSYTTGGPVDSSPVVAGGTVYVGSWDANVYALNAATGHLRWSYATGDYVNASPVVAGGTVYVGSWDDKVYALNAATGHLLWFYTTGKHVDASAAVVNHIFYVSSAYTVYVGSYDDNVYALDAANGHIRWVYITTGSVDSSPAVASGVLYIGSNDGNVYALGASSGHLLWSYTTGGSVDSSPAVASGVLYIGSNDDKVYALNAATGHLLWSYTTGGQVWSRPAVAGGLVYVGSTDGSVYALNNKP